MIRIRGSQYREVLEESGMEVYQGPNEDGEVLLMDMESGNIEVWIQNDDYAGYVIEIDGIGYEFVRTHHSSIQEID